MSRDPTELVGRYRELYTGAVTDTLDELGYMDQVLPNSITPLTLDMRVAGIAYPVQGRPDPDADYDENIRRFLEMLGEAPSNSVVAYETNDDEAAHLGELSAAALAARGARGAVIDGGVRDVGMILDQGFPVFSRYTTPIDAPPRWRLEDWNVPVRIGDIEIRPGDIIVGDADGVACVPRDIAAEVVDRAEATVDTEAVIRDKVNDGVAPLDAFDEHGKF